MILHLQILLGLSILVFGQNQVRDIYPIEFYPYHVSIEKQGIHICSGALFDTKKILTAASCTFGLKETEITVRAGTSHWERDGNLLNVSTLVLHPRYQTNTKDYDIAVVTLTKAIIPDKTMKPISLPKSPESPEAGSRTVQTGWGITDGLKYDLEKLDLDITPQTECIKAYSKAIISISTRMMCAEATIRREDCTVDIGSPLVYRDTILGVSIYEEKCGDEEYPGVYTDVAKYLDWIK